MDEWMNEHFREKALGVLHSFCLSLSHSVCVWSLLASRLKHCDGSGCMCFGSSAEAPGILRTLTGRKFSAEFQHPAPYDKLIIPLLHIDSTREIFTGHPSS